MMMMMRESEPALMPIIGIEEVKTGSKN